MNIPNSHYEFTFVRYSTRSRVRRFFPTINFRVTNRTEFTGKIKKNRSNNAMWRNLMNSFLYTSFLKRHRTRLSRDKNFLFYQLRRFTTSSETVETHFSSIVLERWDSVNDLAECELLYVNILNSPPPHSPRNEYPALSSATRIALLKRQYHNCDFNHVHWHTRQIKWDVAPVDSLSSPRLCTTPFERERLTQPSGSSRGRGLWAVPP